MSRKSSMQCKAAGVIGTVHLLIGNKQHTAHGAEVAIVTNRNSLLEVEFTRSHGIHAKGSTILVADADFVKKVSSEQTSTTRVT